MANLVTLEISFASGGADESAKLCWKNDEGAEQEYARVQLRARVRQETFPGHRWLLRGEQTGTVLWEGVAAARPAVQPIVVHSSYKHERICDARALRVHGRRRHDEGMSRQATASLLW